MPGAPTCGMRTYRPVNSPSASSVNKHFRKAMFIYWGIVIGMGICANIFASVKRRASTQAITHPEGSTQNRRISVFGRLLNLVRANLLIPATFNKTCDVHSWFGTIPPRAETIIISIYVAINVILTAVSNTAFQNNLFWQIHSLQTWRLLADRTGFMAYANLTLFFIFGIRNNILIWMTGWSFPTFNRFHRWTARIATLQAVIHSISYTVPEYLQGGFKQYAENWTMEYW